MYCIREINLIGMRFLCLPDDYGLCNQFAEVVHGELGKNLLEDELHLFCVEMKKSQSVFQVAERGLNTPAHRIKPLNIM